MGDELVSSSDFPSLGGELNKGLTAPVSYTERFNQYLPYYLSIGMPYDQFWYGSNDLKKAYRQAHEIKVKRENFNLWLEGKYFYDALCAVSPLFRFSTAKGKIEAHPYLKEPYPTTEKEARERQERDDKIRFEEMKADFESKVAAFNQKFAKENENDKEVTEDAE